jgi:hypothetical protein
MFTYPTLLISYVITVLYTIYCILFTYPTLLISYVITVLYTIYCILFTYPTLLISYVYTGLYTIYCILPMPFGHHSILYFYVHILIHSFTLVCLR